MIKKVVSVLLLLAIIFLAAGFAAYAEDKNMIFVSPSGNDNSSGTIDAPLATLSAAKEKAKNFDGKVTVYFREGTYTIENTVNFDADDKSDVVYKAYSNEKVIFTSGSPNTGFDECTVNGVRAFKKDIGKGADFNILFNEKTTLSRTRYPENGYLYVSETSDDDIQPGDDKNDTDDKNDHGENNQGGN